MHILRKNCATNSFLFSQHEMLSIDSHFYILTASNVDSYSIFVFGLALVEVRKTKRNKKLLFFNKALREKYQKTNIKIQNTFAYVKWETLWHSSRLESAPGTLFAFADRWFECYANRPQQRTQTTHFLIDKKWTSDHVSILICKNSSLLVIWFLNQVWEWRVESRFFFSKWNVMWI